MSKRVTRRQAFSALINGKKIRRIRWADDNWVMYISNGDNTGLKYSFDISKLENGSLCADVLFGLLSWDDWEIVE